MTKKQNPITREIYAQYLRERIYGSITLLAVNVGMLLSIEHLTVKHAISVVVTTAVGLWLASLFAEYLSYRVVHDAPMPKKAFRGELIVHRALLVAAIPSLILLGFAWLDVIELRTALIADIALALISFIYIIVRAAKTPTSGLKTTFVSAGTQVAAALIIISLKLGAH